MWWFDAYWLLYWFGKDWWMIEWSKPHITQLLNSIIDWEKRKALFLFCVAFRDCKRRKSKTRRWRCSPTSKIKVSFTMISFLFLLLIMSFFWKQRNCLHSRQPKRFQWSQTLSRPTSNSSSWGRITVPYSTWVDMFFCDRILAHSQILHY